MNSEGVSRNKKERRPPGSGTISTRARHGPFRSEAHHVSHGGSAEGGGRPVDDGNADIERVEVLLEAVRSWGWGRSWISLGACSNVT